MSLNKFTIQKSFAISAGAGSGKTYTLSRRYINALLGFDYFREDYKNQHSYYETLKSAKVNQIITITYTEAAALEMKGRIFELVSKIINPTLKEEDEDYESIQDANAHISDEANSYVQKTLARAFRDSSNAKISTIHAYCLDIIKANADIAKIDTKLDIIKDDEKAKELSIIIFEVLNDEANMATVLEISKNISMFFIRGLIDKYVSSAKFRSDYDSFGDDSFTREAYMALMWELYPLPNVQENLDAFKSYLMEHDLEEKEAYIEFVEAYVDRFKHLEPMGWSALSKEHGVTIAFNRKPWTRHKEIKESVDTIKELEDYIDIYAPVNDEKENDFFEKIKKIKTLLHQIKSKYDERLKALGKIDFDTIITRTLESMPDVKTNFKYIMVDEFQDTNETQFAIVKKSAEHSNANLFVVGDSKQSIYSFQGAEIEVFNNAVQDTSLFASIEKMSTNYRSDGKVLKPVNEIFEVLLKKDEQLKIISQNYEAEAQALNVSKTEKEERGSFNYLITSQPYLERDDETEKEEEMDTIAQFIEEVYKGERDAYKHISERIAKKQKAIAVLFDGGEKMLQLKVKLRERGITAKISKSDNFYHTKEINDIFNVLKAIDILSKKPEEFSDTQKYYIVGAMRSNILRVDDNRIKQHIDANTVDDRLSHYVEVFKTLPLVQAIKYIYDDANIMGVYVHLDDVEQRSANLYKFLMLCKEYEESSESNLYQFLSLLENAIYFSEAKEDEAFFQSDNTKSIELCTIHSTKGLAYPMVILANADKGLYTQITSDALKNNNFTMNGEKKEIVGFKINDYIPLSHRVLKQIDKMKHLAEKKRLLYVALTRAEHDVVISAYLKAKKDGDITLREDSYLSMITKAFDIDVEELYGQNEAYCMQMKEQISSDSVAKPISYIAYTLKPVTFTQKSFTSATKKEEGSTEPTVNMEAAKLGTVTHKIVELYWKNFNEHQEAILNKMAVFDNKQREAIAKSIQAFYKSDVYTKLQDGIEHHFELEFNVDGKTGFIDFLYFDKEKEGWVIVDFKTGAESTDKNEQYQKQLDFYKEVMEEKGCTIVDTQLLWL